MHLSSRIILRLSGNLDLEAGNSLQATVEPLLHNASGCIFIPVVLDMAEVTGITADGIRTLDQLKQRAAACLGAAPSPRDLLRIANPPLAVRNALEEAGLLKAFTGWQEHICRLPAELPADDSFHNLIGTIRRAFPSPVSDSFHDAYLGQSLLHGLQAVNARKGCTPMLQGGNSDIDYTKARTGVLHENMQTVEQTVEQLAAYFDGHPIWGHALVQPNVIPPSSIPAVIGSLMASLYNPNMIWDGYSRKVSEAEVEASAICAHLLGLPPETAAGLFTWGGTGTTFYGVRLGIEKAQPGAFAHGVQPGMKMIASSASHYCKLNALGWQGLGTDNLVTIPVDADNAMRMDKLEEAMRRILDKGEHIACLLATMGTTDAFGLDPLTAMADLRDRLTQEYQLEYTPHLHADAVIGWAWSVFNDYDFNTNSMRFPERTLRSLWDVRNILAGLPRADSVGLDFHKTGYTPYLSSLFLVREKKDLTLITRDKALMPYLFQFGNYHPGMFTMESSRGGGGVLSALANLKMLGKQGYRALLGYIVTIAESLRMRLEQAPHAVVVNNGNHGPVTLFRVYPDGTDPNLQYQKEVADPSHDADLEKHNRYNRAVFDALHQKMLAGECLEISLTEQYCVSAGGRPVLALKSYVMTPFVEEESMTRLMLCIEEVRKELARTRSY
ncbi:pyridoxal-dependent decarboxylase [Desulfovibrio mangrovi]|uniref:pyridoxal-dependent decarboxylase n=1 Tax=Desulfovibrio mangrovi TaxID=2976983 RepID=UPI00224590D3|nr:pyridoxal-dependent decarboxylase [Desulfovibrio mangrovi]UZP66194.1 pyridoxal-dependent decarboxylase [Desulfovibrio mangrovi]